MNEQALRGLIAEVKDGKLSRRAFINQMIALGLTAPLATQMLTYSGVAHAQTKSDYKPTKRGGGGPLKVLWWQGATLLNPHFAVGTKDQDGSRIFYEPLAGWDPDGALYPGARRRDSRISKTAGSPRTASRSPGSSSRASRGTTASRSPPTTSCSTGNTPPIRRPPRPPSAATRTSRSRRSTTHTVRVLFAKPTPFWADAFVGVRGMIIPKHLFADYIGAKSRDAPANLKPVGTGPYKFVDFKPGDMVRGEINPNYHIANRPHFDTIEMKGGGDAVSAARAVLQTGEYDYAWNLQVEDEILLRLEKGGKGKTDMVARRQYRAHPAQLDRPVDRGRRRALEHEDQAPAAVRQGGAAGAGPC